MSGLVGQVGARSGVIGSTTDSTQLDYEEGTWTPEFAGNANGNGTYIKIGGLVFVKADTTNTSGAGRQTVGGLPFNTATPHSTWHVGYASGNTVHGGYFNNATDSFNSVVSGGTTGQNINDNTRILMSGTYTTI